MAGSFFATAGCGGLLEVAAEIACSWSVSVTVFGVLEFGSGWPERVAVPTGEAEEIPGLSMFVL